VYGRAEMPPPVKVNPPLEEREVTLNPPENVDEAVEVIKNDPPEMAIPLVAWRVEVMSPV